MAEKLSSVKSIDTGSVSRRHFLAVGGAGVSSLALVGCTGSGTDRAVPPLPVAYATGSDAANGLTDRLVAGAHPADELPGLVSADRAGGDRGLMEQGRAWVTIHGLYGAEAHPELSSLLLSVRMGGSRFQAWGYAAGPVPRISPATTFPVPLAGGQGLTLELERTGSRPGAQEHAVVLGDLFGSPLRRGTYVVALDSDAWADGTPGPLAGAKFPYVVVSVSATDPRVG